MLIGISRETFPGERRVALVPAEIPRLQKRGFKVLMETGAGLEAGYPDDVYADKGAKIASTRSEVFKQAQILPMVRGFGANASEGRSDLKLLSSQHTVVGFCDPLGSPQHAQTFADTGATLFAVELVPRITRAQSMDALSSMATITGYRSVLLAAEALPKMFPMLMTAAGTVAPANVFVLGVGVAGLQAIATAKRLGAVVEAYDIRPEVKDQVVSVGGTFVELPLETSDASGAGGYAKAQGDEFIAKQQALMLSHVAKADAVITTAAVPGRRAPLLVTEDMVHAMRPGAVVVDLAAETGGNCACTRAGETVDVGGVQVLGPVNVASTIPYHASQMYGRNLSTFLLHLAGEGDAGTLTVDPSDEITGATLVAREGKLVHPRVLELQAAAQAPRQESA